jgi:D-aminoacyl-tRNA deacylase
MEKLIPAVITVISKFLKTSNQNSIRMRVVIQRVAKASVTIEGKEYSKIGAGLLLLVAFEESDCNDDIEWLCNKIINLRIFADTEDKMNLSLMDVGGEILSVSQFTLFASTKKGNRPSYSKSAKPEIAIPLYDRFNIRLGELSGKKVQTGLFGAMMDIALVNDGPVTIVIDTKEKE